MPSALSMEERCDLDKSAWPAGQMIGHVDLAARLLIRLIGNLVQA
jgi:hypothetical protein